MKMQIPEDKLVPIKQALFQGQKIEAIKLYREYTETGLAEAKSAVEELEAELRKSSPNLFSAKPAGKGCMGVVMVVCAIATIVVLGLFRS
jgi:hypothetical protein